MQSTDKTKRSRNKDAFMIQEVWNKVIAQLQSLKQSSYNQNSKELKYEYLYQ